MRYEIRKVIYPEGDEQEIEWSLRFHQVVDVRGRPLALPLPTVRMLAYRVFRISTDELRDEEVTSYHLEQLPPGELSDYTDNRR